MINLKTAIRSSSSRNVISPSLNVATRVDTVWPSVNNRYSKWWLSPLLVEFVSTSVSLKMVYSCFTVSVVALDTGLCVCVCVGGGGGKEGMHGNEHERTTVRNHMTSLPYVL